MLEVPVGTGNNLGPYAENSRLAAADLSAEMLGIARADTNDMLHTNTPHYFQFGAQPMHEINRRPVELTGSVPRTRHARNLQP